MFSQPVRQPGNTRDAVQGMELGCPKHSAGKWTEQEETSVPKGNEENISTSLCPSVIEVNFIIASWKVFTKQQHWTEVLEPERPSYSQIWRTGPAGCKRAKYAKDRKANFRRCYCCLCKILAFIYICPRKILGSSTLLSIEKLAMGFSTTGNTCRVSSFRADVF